MAMMTLLGRQEAVRTLESRLIKALTLARLSGDAVVTRDGRFKVKAMLGRGASGVVCSAVDTKMTRPLALKLYPGLPDDDLAAGVRAEARALAQLRHGNVVTAYDFDASELRPSGIWCFYVSMELLPGPSLRRWLAQGPPVAQVIERFCQAGDGLAAAHAAGLVHRDFKPENVMLDGETPKIVDFGLAREVMTTGLAPIDSHQRAIVGTLAYMAPEALVGRANAQSDVFSFAAAVWEACYGEFPYAIDTLDPAARRRITPPRRRASLPEGLYGCLSRALRGDPKDRTGTIAELVSELRSLGPIVEAMPTTSMSAAAMMTSDASRPASAGASASTRRAVGVGVVLAFAIVGAAGVIGALWSAGLWETGVARGEGESDAVDTEDSIVVADLGTVDSIIDTTATSDAGVGPPTAAGQDAGACPSEEAYVGAWLIETEATKDTQRSGIGIRGRYDVDVRLDSEGCRLEVEVAKIRMGNIDMRSDPRRSTVEGKVEQTKDGDALILHGLALRRTTEARAPFVYAMRLQRVGDGVRGIFEGSSSDGRRLSGPLRGRRR